MRALLATALVVVSMVGAWMSFRHASPPSYLGSHTQEREALYSNSWNQAAQCIDLANATPAIRWNSSASAGWISALGGLMTAACFTGITILMSRTSVGDQSEGSLVSRPTDPQIRSVSFAWLGATLLAGLVVTFMFSQLSGENECTARTSMLLAASLGLMALVAGFLVALQWLLQDTKADEPRVFLLLLYLVSITGVAIFAAVSISNFTNWPTYAMIPPREVLVRFVAVGTGAAAAWLMKPVLVSSRNALRTCEYMALGVLGATVVGMAIFVLAQSTDAGDLGHHRGPGWALLYCGAAAGLIFVSTIALPPLLGTEPSEATSDRADSIVLIDDRGPVTTVTLGSGETVPADDERVTARGLLNDARILLANRIRGHPEGSSGVERERTPTG